MEKSLGIPATATNNRTEIEIPTYVAYLMIDSERYSLAELEGHLGRIGDPPSWSKGEIQPPRSTPYPASCWQLRVEVSEADYDCFMKKLTGLLEQIALLQPRIQEIQKDIWVTFQFNFNHHQGEDKPSFYLTAEQVQLLASIHAMIDMDLYLYGKRKRPTHQTT